MLVVDSSRLVCVQRASPAAALDQIQGGGFRWSAEHQVTCSLKAVRQPLRTAAPETPRAARSPGRPKAPRRVLAPYQKAARTVRHRALFVSVAAYP
jgi:hypothetical protein